MGLPTTRELLHAVDALGWSGELLPAARLLGETVHVVATPHGDRPQIVGIVAARCRWESAMRAASGFLTVAARAVVLPANAPYSLRAHVAAATTGVGVVRVGRDRAEVTAWPSPPVLRRRTLAHRLVEEAVDACFLTHAASRVD